MYSQLRCVEDVEELEDPTVETWMNYSKPSCHTSAKDTEPVLAEINTMEKRAGRRSQVS